VKIQKYAILMGEGKKKAGELYPLVVTEGVRVNVDNSPSYTTAVQFFADFIYPRSMELDGETNFWDWFKPTLERFEGHRKETLAANLGSPLDKRKPEAERRRHYVAAFQIVFPGRISGKEASEKVARELGLWLWPFLKS